MVTVLPKKYTNGSINIKPKITKITPIKRDKKKKEFCEKHNLEVLCIPRDCARDYLNIKESLVSLMSVRK